MNAAQLCELLQGELIGDGHKKISGPSQIDDGKPDTVTFLANPKYEEFVYTTDAAAIVVSKEFQLRQPVHSAIIKVEDVYGAMMFLIEKFSQNGTPSPGIAETSIIHTSSHLGKSVSIGAYAIIESGVTIGDRVIVYPGVFIGHGSFIEEDVILYPGVKIYANTSIGKRSIIHANAVIGCDGFGYRPNELGHYQKIRHVGNVIIEDDVEIGANTVIDRGTLSVTKIGKGSKIDNLVQIAHNVIIGEHTVIAAQSGIAGSATVGNHVRIGGQAGIAGHIHIEDNIEIQAQSGVHTGKFPKGSRLFGYPAFHYLDYLKSYTIFKKLPLYIKRIEALEKQLSANKKKSQ